MIQQRFPDAEYREEGCWFRVPSYPLPEGLEPDRDGCSVPDSPGIPGATALRFLRSIRDPVPRERTEQLHRTGGESASIRWDVGPIFLGSRRWTMETNGGHPQGIQSAQLGGGVRREVPRWKIESSVLFCSCRATSGGGFGSTCLAMVRFDEAAGFLFARHRLKTESKSLRLSNGIRCHPMGMGWRNEYHFELTDQVRAQVIKRAHDLGASIVEVHSYGGRWPAAFRPVINGGFGSSVPHVWWRLKGRSLSGGGCHKAGFRWLGVADWTGRLATSRWHRG